MNRSKIRSLNGQDLREMFAAATDWLEKAARDIDSLNVFPVPDGDCGTNMLFTMRSAVEAAYQTSGKSVSAIAKSLAQGALMGARGNSGVILSQIWRGISESVEDKETIDGKGLAQALILASEKAYKALNKPVEGTILTVMREAAEAARKQAADETGDIIEVLEAAVKASADAVANTPNLLPVLRESGVVDAGGEGLFTLLDGALRHLKGETEQMKLRKPRIIQGEVSPARVPGIVRGGEIPWGYSIEFLLKGARLEPDKIRSEIESMGKNVVIAGDEFTVRVHIHSPDPGRVFSYAVSLGTLHQVTIRNLDEQYQDFLRLQKERMPGIDTAVVAVASGEGLVEVFRSLGAAAIVPGGQTMNPSTAELLQAIETVPSEKIIILPNNKNIIPVANQLSPLTSKKVAVVPAETIPQGIASLLAFNYQTDFETNVRFMDEARTGVQTIEVTRAVRPAKFGDLEVKEGQSIGFLEGNLVSVEDNPALALYETLNRMDAAQAEVITIYYGADTEPSEAEEAGTVIRQKYTHLQVEVIKGGQPFYNYIVSVE